MSPTTGEVRAGRPKRCMRKLCPACGDLVLRQNVAHTIGKLEPGLDRLLFLSLTLDGEATGPNGRATVTACWNGFRDRLAYRAARRGETLRYVAHKQTDDGGRWHLHAVVETSVDPATVRGLWFKAGGGVESDAQPVLDREHLGAAVCYTLQQLKQPGNGPVMYGGGIGYNAARARAERAEYARDLYGHTWDPDVRLVFDPARPSADRRPDGEDGGGTGGGDPDPPDVSGRRTSSVSPCGGRLAGRYAVLSRYAGGRVTVHPAVRSGSGWRELGTTPTKRAARRAVRRHDARRRQSRRHRG